LGISIAALISARIDGGENMRNMLWTIFAILLILWIIGMATSYLVGGLIHILLGVAVIILIIKLVEAVRNKRAV
jgi:hypothetical protein